MRTEAEMEVAGDVGRGKTDRAGERLCEEEWEEEESSLKSEMKLVQLGGGVCAVDGALRPTSRACPVDVLVQDRLVGVWHVQLVRLH
jgi:hypothetical protein